MQIKIFKISFILGCFLLLLSSCQKEISKEESIKQVKSLISKNKYETLEKLDSVLFLGEQNSDFKRGLLYYHKAKVYGNKLRDYKSAIENFEQAITIFETTKNQEYLLGTYFGLGTSYAIYGDKTASVENLLKALELSKQLKNTQKEAQIYSMLAHSFFQYKNYKKAVDYTQKSIDLYTLKKDTIGLSETYNNLAVIYKNSDNLPKALEYNLKSLELNEIMKNNRAIAMSYNNLGQVYELMKDDEKASKYYKKAMEINHKNEIFNPKPIANLGEFFFKKNDVKQAEFYFKKAFDMSEKHKNTYILHQMSDKLLQISLKNKDYENAMIYLDKKNELQLLKTELDNKERLQLNESQFKLSAKQTELQQVKVVNDRNRIIFISVLAFGIVLGILFFQRLKTRQLKLEKEKIVLESTVLRSQMNPHFIFNALSAIQNSLFENDPMKSASYLSNFAKLIRQNFDFTSQQEISLAEEIDALENYIKTQQIRFVNRFDYELNIDENINLELTKIPPLLLQPLVENCIEHGFKAKQDKGLIKIDISQTDSIITYCISDNGKGFDTQTNDEKLHSLEVVKKRLSLLKGTKNSVTISTNENGTSVKITIAK